jgi:hypothetical protein
MKRLIGWLAAILAAASTILLGLSKIPWPDAQYWADHIPVLALVVVLAAATPVAQRAIAEYGEGRAERERKRDESIRIYLNASFVQIHHLTNAPMTRMGVQAFLVKRSFKPNWSFSWRPAEQRRVVRVKLHEAQAPSGIRWTEGKGLIGECWRRRDRCHVNLEEHFAKYRALGEDEWKALPLQERFGLEFDEFQRTKGRYGLLAAVPIIDKADPGRYLGCVSFDTPLGCPPIENWDDVLDSLGVAALTISTLL